jgi:hypothetical protein
MLRDRRSRGGKITPDQARPMRHERKLDRPRIHHRMLVVRGGPVPRCPQGRRDARVTMADGLCPWHPWLPGPAWPRWSATSGVARLALGEADSWMILCLHIQSGRQPSPTTVHAYPRLEGSCPPPPRAILPGLFRIAHVPKATDMSLLPASRRWAMNAWMLSGTCTTGALALLRFSLITGLSFSRVSTASRAGWSE